MRRSDTIKTCVRQANLRGGEGFAVRVVAQHVGYDARRLRLHDGRGHRPRRHNLLTPEGFIQFCDEGVPDRLRRCEFRFFADGEAGDHGVQFGKFLLDDGRIDAERPDQSPRLAKDPFALFQGFFFGGPRAQ